jgi:hypothetical protein
MAKFFLLNTVIVATTKYFAGQTIDDTLQPKADIEAAGGALVSTTDENVSLTAAATLCEKLRAGKAVNEATLDAIMLAAMATKTKGSIQKGTGTLAAGTLTVTGVVLDADSRIIVTMKDPGAGAITGFADLAVPAGSRTATQFVVNAIDAAKATIGTAVCTFDWIIVG